MHYAGWWVEDNPVILKEMIMTAFPRISNGTMSADNVKQTSLNCIRAMSQLTRLSEDEPNPLTETTINALRATPAGAKTKTE